MEKDKNLFFKKATAKLLTDLDKMKLSKREHDLAVHYTCLFRESFHSDAVKRQTFPDEDAFTFELLKYDADGFCRASSKAFSILMNHYSGTQNWQIMYIDDMWTYGPHHFIKHIPSGINFDLTFDQYAIENKQIPYHMGRQTRFLLHEDSSPLNFALANGISIIDVLKERN